ncbi:MAG: hypothetical protein AB1345_12400 [Chloroflexota bacterium]
MDILAQRPGVVVRYRLMRDVLKRVSDDPEVVQAREALNSSIGVQELAAEQREDGSWGAFHSRSTQLKQKIPSTEVGVERALSLGLDAAHPILKKATGYILDTMQGKQDFPDYHEKNDRWQTGMRLFLASTLSLIHPTHPMLDQDRELWHEIARRTFQSGKYREEDEIRAHAELTGATVKNSYLVINGRYQLNILGSQPGTLSQDLEKRLLGWICEKPEGIGYLEARLNHPPQPKPGYVDRWLASWELLARLFPTWREFAVSAIEWLWDARNEQGYWDFGPRPSSIANLPLSESWKTRENRLFDWSTRVLNLLRAFYESDEIVNREYPLTIRKG